MPAWLSAGPDPSGIKQYLYASWRKQVQVSVHLGWTVVSMEGHGRGCRHAVDVHARCTSMTIGVCSVAKQSWGIMAYIDSIFLVKGNVIGSYAWSTSVAGMTHACMHAGLQAPMSCHILCVFKNHNMSVFPQRWACWKNTRSTKFLSNTIQHL